MNKRKANKCTLPDVRSGAIHVESEQQFADLMIIAFAKRSYKSLARTKADRYRGRKPSFSREQFEAVRDLLVQEEPIGRIANTTGLSRQTVYRIKDNPTAALAALAMWGM